MTSPTTTRDAIGLSERLRDAKRRWVPIMASHPAFADAALLTTMDEAATQLDALQERVSALQKNDEAMAAQIKTLVGQKTEWMDRATRFQQERDKLQGMLLLCGELGGIGNNETPVTYLRRLIDGLIEAQQERDEAYERAAKIIDTECERVLSKQTSTNDPLSMTDTVNLNLRMMAVLLPELAAAIRQLASGPDKENPNV